MCSLRSRPPLNTVFPSAANATANTGSGWSLYDASAKPVFTSNTRHDLSRLAVTSSDPSGLNATSVTQSACGSAFQRSLPVVRSYTRSPPSDPPAASVLPSGLNRAQSIRSGVFSSVRGAEVGLSISSSSPLTPGVPPATATRPVWPSTAIACTRWTGRAVRPVSLPVFGSHRVSSW
jgi:hypothetical protein